MKIFGAPTFFLGVARIQVIPPDFGDKKLHQLGGQDVLEKGVTSWFHFAGVKLSLNFEISWESKGSPPMPRETPRNSRSY